MPSIAFIGAGPGDPDLITVKGRRYIEQADVVLYAGSLVPRALVACARQEAELIDSADMTLEQTHAILTRAHAQGKQAVRVHTGDSCLYGAIREQMHLLDKEGIAYEVIPGVTAAFAGAAGAALSFTVPEKTQTLIITRLAGRTPVPERENLADLARHGSAMAVYLSAADPEGVVSQLRAGGLEEGTVIVVAHRVGWPDEYIIQTTLGNVVDIVREKKLLRQTVFLVFPGEYSGQDDAEKGQQYTSKLYDATFSHGFRK